jgi:O-antigen/teichoic acid export membrane protein
MKSNSSLRSRLQAGIVLNLLGAVFNQGSTFVFTIVAANILGKEVFGKYGMVQSTLVTLSQVAQFACGYTATKYIAEFRSTDKAKTGRIISVLFTTISLSAGIVALGLFVAVPWLATTVLRAPELRAGLAMGAGVVFLSVLNGFAIGALAGFEAYGKLAIALVLSGVTYLAICTLFASKAGLNGAFAGLLLSAFIQWLLLRNCLKTECARQGITFRYRLFSEGRSILLQFTLPAALSGLTFLPALWLSSAILARRPQGYSQMALFSAAYTAMAAVLFIPNVTNIVSWSMLNFHKGRGQTSLYQRTFWVNCVVSCTVVLLGVVAVAELGQQVLHLFGGNFSDGYVVLLVMLAASISQALVLALFQHLQSQGRMWLSFFAVILPRDVLLVSLAYYLIPTYHAVGLATAYLVAWSFALIVLLTLVLNSVTLAEPLDSIQSGVATPNELTSNCP